MEVVGAGPCWGQGTSIKMGKSSPKVENCRKIKCIIHSSKVEENVSVLVINRKAKRKECESDGGGMDGMDSVMTETYISEKRMKIGQLVDERVTSLMVAEVGDVRPREQQ